METNQILDLFKQCNAIMSGHFLLTSGRHSDTYMQCAKLFEDPQISEKLCKELLQIKKDLQVDIVVSPAIGGILMGYEVAKQLGVKNIFAERVDGQMTLKRGFTVPQGSKVLVVEDVVTTGGSIQEVIALLQSLQTTVVACCSIVDRSNGKTTFPVPYFSLLSLEVTSHTPQECPQCQDPTIPPAYKMGSRNN